MRKERCVYKPRIVGAALAATVGLPISKHDDSASFAWLNSQLEPEKLYELAPRGNKLALKLTMAGWEKYEKLKKTTPTSENGLC
jgi:hypothetical protein